MYSALVSGWGNTNPHSDSEDLLKVLKYSETLRAVDLTIETNDDVLDWTRMTTVEMTGIRPEQNYPSASERRIIQMSFDFNVPIWISVPTQIKQD